MRSNRPVPEARGAAPVRRQPAAVPAVPAYVLLAAVVVFIVYGSLFPFDFASEGLPLERFFAESAPFANQSDAIDNFFLFVPLGIALQLAFRRPAARIAAALLAVLVLAIGIQLVQLYLPSRTASLSDAFWNSAGMGAGFLVAARVRRSFQRQLSARAPAGRDDFLLCLIALWFLYESFPFVPTLDIGELRAHVKSAIFAPPFELMRLVQHALAAVLAGIAVTRLGMLRRPALGVIALGAISMTLEVLVAYGNLRRETLLGIALGLGAGYLAARRAPQGSARLTFALALGALLITVLTPYRGETPDRGFTLTPFSHVLWHGMVNDLPPLAFEALAIGVLLWSGMAASSRLRARPWLWSIVVLLLLALLEWVRIALAGFHGDTTTWAMALVLAPAAVALRMEEGGGLPPPARTVLRAPDKGPARPGYAALGACAAVLTLAMWALLQLPGIPYNLKKLFGDHALVGSAVFSLALLWLGSGPWLAARMMLQREARWRQGVWLAPLLLVGIALVSFVLVDFATPAIMLNKIVGAPDLYRRIVEDNYWGEAWRAGLSAWPRGLVSAVERVVRFVALYSVFSIPLVIGVLALPRQDRRARVIVYTLGLLPFWLLAKMVVLDWAITDNLTELVADGGAIALAAVIVLFSVNAMALAAYRRGGREVPLLALATAALACAGWWLFNDGIEAVVLNNGRLFSGVQFLLGADRVTLLSAPWLFARWCLAYGAGLTVVAAGVVLSRRLLPLPIPGLAPHR